jgi:putative glutamine amidotransferase
MGQPGQDARRRTRPLVGITCDFLEVLPGEVKYTVYARYVRALREAGAWCVLLPPEPSEAAHHLDLVDGILLPGGKDLDPALWGGVAGPVFEPSDERRTEYELALTLASLERDAPFLGICLGAQLLNVACGGSLRSDISSGSVVHADEARGLALRHEVDVMKGSVLARAMGLPDGGRVSVNSSHRNAPDGLGGHLRASAMTADGLIEGVEHRDRDFCVGVQWHPEADALTDASSRHLFRSFTEACARRGRLR